MSAMAGDAADAGLQLYGGEIDPPTRRVHALDANHHRVAEPDRLPRLGAEHHDLEGVELPPVAPHAAYGEQPLVPVAERDERPRADHADHFARPRGVPSALEQLPLQEE